VRMWKSILVVTVVAMLLATLAVGRWPRTSGAGQATAEPAADTGKIAWLTSLPEALEAARAEHKPILVDFFATWCGPCRLMDEETWPQAEVVAAAGKYVAVRLDVDAHQQTAAQFDVTGIPTVVFLDASGKEKHRSVGFVDAAAMLELLSKHKP